MTVFSAGLFHWKVTSKDCLTLSVGRTPAESVTAIAVSASDIPAFAEAFEDAVSLLGNVKTASKIKEIDSGLPKYIKAIDDSDLTQIIIDALSDLSTASLEWGIAIDDLKELLKVYKSLK